MTSDNLGICNNKDLTIRIWKKGYKTKEFIVDDNTPRNEMNQISITLEKE